MTQPFQRKHKSQFTWRVPTAIYHEWIELATQSLIVQAKR